MPLVPPTTNAFTDMSALEVITRDKAESLFVGWVKCLLFKFLTCISRRALGHLSSPYLAEKRQPDLWRLIST